MSPLSIDYAITFNLFYFKKYLYGNRIQSRKF